MGSIVDAFESSLSAKNPFFPTYDPIEDVRIFPEEEQEFRDEQIKATVYMLKNMYPIHEMSIFNVEGT